MAVLTALTLGATTAYASDDVVVHDLAVTPQQRQAVLDHWTPERIAAMPTGPSTPGTPPADGPDGAPAAPDRSIGRLFFVDRDGADESCTATVVAPSVVVTAGHCVHELNLIGEDPKWTSDLLFVPGFRDNTRPYGSFVARQSVVDKTWTVDDQHTDHDQAFLVLNGHVGGVPHPIGYDVPGALPVTEYGYPRAARKPEHQGRPEFTGQRLARCYGTAIEDPGQPDFPQDKGIWGVPCDMGGGSSGGPRMVGPLVVGVDVQSAYPDPTCHDSSDLKCPRYLVGPQFTTAVTRPLYERALHLA
ncbi:hypothetical protein GCM10029964_039850 [Kibdelosporangium lantanae]